MKVKVYRGYQINREKKGERNEYSIEFCDVILKFTSLTETVMFIDDLLPCD